MDSLLKEYDVPKIYLHKLGDSHPERHLYKYALVDGKQRFETIKDFFTNKFPLDFQEKGSLTKDLKEIHGKTFGELSKDWKTEIEGILLDVVYIHDADEDQIEDLFARLNQGEPLNAAEQRNAVGGKMCQLVRDTSKHKFFTDTLPTENKRYIHYDIACRFLLIEYNIIDNNEAYCDLKKKFLDKLVKENKNLDPKTENGLRKAVDTQLQQVMQIFEKKDEPLLKKPAHPQLYYLFRKRQHRDYAVANSVVKSFLEKFQEKRTKALGLSLDEREDDEHRILEEFERLMRQGNDKNSLRDRVKYLLMFLLKEHGDAVTINDEKKRNFTEEERYALYISANKKCAICGNKIKSFDDCEADHIKPFSKGGETSLKNGQAVHMQCNREKSNK